MWEYNRAVCQVFIDFEEAYDSVRTEVLYNILSEFGITMKVLRLIKMFLNDTCMKFFTGKILSDSFTTQNGLK
jgi:hypothetical protein